MKIPNERRIKLMKTSDIRMAAVVIVPVAVAFDDLIMTMLTLFLNHCMTDVHIRLQTTLACTTLRKWSTPAPLLALIQWH